MPLVLLVGLLALIPAVISMIMRFVSRVVDVLVQPVMNFLNTEDPQVPLSPADAADMVERNIISMSEGTSEAGQSGINPHRFGLMVQDTGEPYGIEQALSLLRRGKIDEDRFSKVLYYSRVRNEFLPDVLDLTYEPMSGADAIEAALKAILPDSEARAAWARAGGIAGEYDTVLAAAGNPIGVEQANMLYLHGLISHDQLVSVIRHSRINPAFESMAELLRFHYIPAFQIRQMLAAGSVDAASATRWLTQQGYPADQIAAFVAAGTATKVTKHKELSVTQVTDLYEAGALDAAGAEAHLQGLGYDPSEVGFILAVYDQKRELSMVQSAVTQVRKTYLAHRIDRSTASNKLDALHIHPQIRDYYLDVWDVEATSELKELTMAQVGSAFKKGLITDTDAMNRWLAMGYTAEDAAILLGIYGGNPPAGSPAAQAPASSPASSSAAGG